MWDMEQGYRLAWLCECVSGVWRKSTVWYRGGVDVGWGVGGGGARHWHGSGGLKHSPLNKYFSYWTRSL